MAGPQSPILSIQDLKKSYGPVEVLKGISFDVFPRQVVGLLGRSGSGKSTLLRCLNFLEIPNSGRILLENEEVGVDSSQARRRPHPAGVLARQRRQMAMVFQNFNLWPHMTVIENVIEGPVRVLGLSQEEARAGAMRLLRDVGMEHKADQYPIRLSGGQQQRVAIARALAMRPKLMLFDEPTSSLDPELVAEVLRVMRDLAEAGTTMLVVTHEMAFARDVCDRVMLLHEGRLIEAGPPREVMLESQNPIAASFFAGLRGEAAMSEGS
ncbi:amino acid ABC transporter ATP-binding protein [Pseudogemmobacter bohemicus]|uniref:amino acid ABC transporter ATP-binding protein n=1 Tax=Pseudogemmobacter bohemicus TaxID=2250708 RepID=UPI000DD4DB96|nr:amino acid ABC transporter ATP-binding protein [Pseudogemmobacter bohemicus]